MQSLLDAPSPATLTLFGAGGEAVTSPVWFRYTGDSFEVVMGLKDQKLEMLRRDPRCTLLIFETAPPFAASAFAARPSSCPTKAARLGWK